MAQIFQAATGSAAALGAELALRGSVTVQLQPPEAVVAGARWSLDAGPEQTSGFNQEAVLPGSHQLHFADLLLWERPDPITFESIGGKTSSLKVVYRPRANYYFRDIPSQTARPSVRLAFLVRAHDPADPNSPAEGTRLAVTFQPAPSGAIHFDSVTGLFDYTPAASDRLPFEVTFTPVGGGEPATVTVVPTPPAAQEESVLLYQRPLPDPESRDFIQITEVPTGTIVFNDASQATLGVDISGHTLVFQSGHPAHLYDSFNGRNDLTALNLYADRVIIRSPLKLSQTHITIHARELRFEGAGSIDTTPKARAKTPSAAVNDETLTKGIDGDPGHDAGSVDVMVEQFHADASGSPRFVLHGGDGGHAGEGRDGFFQEDWRKKPDTSFMYPTGSPEWKALMRRRGVSLCEPLENGGTVVYSETLVSHRRISTCGVMRAPVGEPAVPSGKPGSGGTGGTIVTTLDLSSFADFSGGVAGAKGGDHKGGTFGESFYYAFVDTFRNPKTGEEITTVDSVPSGSLPGPAAVAPAADRPIGQPGKLTLVSNPGSWLHSFLVRAVVDYAKECYLQNHTPEAHQILERYHNFLLAHAAPPADPDSLTDVTFLEKVNLDQLTLKTEALLHRIDSNLDYFGNPVGWVPMLSFEANLLAFQDEVENSVPILYLTYWLNHAATNLQATTTAAIKARESLQKEQARMEVAFNHAQDAIPRLKIQSEAIGRQIVDVQLQLTNKLHELQQRAQENVDDRHKVPFWKKALGTLAVAAELIPVGQPILGEVGAGLNLLTEIDLDKPLESAQTVVPKAFDIFNQQNVSVCFGSSRSNKPPAAAGSLLLTPPPTSGTSTNGDGGQTPKQALSETSACGKFLGGELKQLGDVFKDVKVDSKEVDAELTKLEAQDTEFNENIIKIRDLNKQKEQFAKDLASSMQAIATLTSAMAENVIGTHELNGRIENGFDVLDHGALLHIRAMERRAKDRLLSYAYLLAQSFQYRRLMPFQGDLQLTRIFERFEALVQAGSSHLLTPAEFDNLKGVFTDELRQIIHDSFDEINAPGVSNPGTVTLDPDHLRELNQTGRTTINMHEMGLFGSNQEDIRIVNLSTQDMPVRRVGGKPLTHALVRINYEHSGITRLKSHGNTYLFRHYAPETVNPIVWNSVYDAMANKLSNASPNPDDLSLVAVLLQLDARSREDLQLFSLPGARADITITKEVLADSGVDYELEGLTLGYQIAYRNTSANLRELSVGATGGLTPHITLNRLDTNGRQDGEGGFVRVYPTLAPVTLEAPQTYGRFRFDGWNINQNATTNRSPRLPLVLSQDTRVEARYVLAEGEGSSSIRLRVLPPTAGSFTFDFPTVSGRTYLIETTPQLGAPSWSSSGSRAGDGGRMTISSPANVAKTLFFRVRTQP